MEGIGYSMSHSELHPEEWQRYRGDPIEDGLLFVIRLDPDLETIAPSRPSPPEPPKAREDRTYPGKLWLPRLAPMALVGLALGIALAFWGFWAHYSGTPSKEGAPASARPTPPKPPPKKRLSKEKERDQILGLLKWGKFGMAEAELGKALRSFPGDKELEELMEGLHREFSLKRLKFR